MHKLLENKVDDAVEEVELRHLGHRSSSLCYVSLDLLKRLSWHNRQVVHVGHILLLDERVVDELSTSNDTSKRLVEVTRLLGLFEAILLPQLEDPFPC